MVNPKLTEAYDSAVPAQPTEADVGGAFGECARPAASGGVIWISGYSSAGKTTVGRLVASKLRQANESTIFLDGDDLRSIFGRKWGYERSERVELARVYFRLCSHLASQGTVVVIAAIALYENIREWLTENVPGVLDVFLDVPETERRSRDAAGKRIYPAAGDMSSDYDGPGDASLRLDNYGASTAEATAARIVEAFETRRKTSVSYGRSEHWQRYYSTPNAPDEPSSFAVQVERELTPRSRLLDVGCGNGRDAAYFATRGHRVVASDTAHAAIELARRSHSELPITFLAGSLRALESEVMPVDAVYARFVLHAMPLHEEIELLSAAFGVLEPGGRLFIECRSIDDPLARLGEVISPTERIHGHYRRFIVKDELVDRLKQAGFTVSSVIEDSGCARLGDDNPVVIRATAER